MTLEVNSLTKLYKNGRGVKNVSLCVDNGEVLGLLGPNGSGKTTTMKAICGLVNHSEGAVKICGIDAFLHHEKAMAKTGSLIEAPALFDHMTAWDNMKLAARYYSDIGDDRIGQTLDLVGMGKYKKDKVGTFSLGMRQRIGLALALISSPELLILDEPANGLDIEGMIHIREIVKEEAGSGKAVLISSHLAHEIELCATKAAILYDGALLSVMPMDEILSQSPSLEDFFLTQVTRFRKGELM